jgi:repressor LexA
MRWNSIEAQPRDRHGRVPLAPRQRDVVAAIRRLAKEHGYPPTIRELGDDLGITTPNGVKQHLRLLARKGWVTWEEGKARTLRLVGE